MSYSVYLILALCFFIGEIFTMEFSLACIGIGALGGALVSWIGLGIWPQVGIFAAVTVACWLGIRPIALRHFYKKTKTVKTPAEDVIGQDAVVEIALDPVQGTGRVKIAGESWKATAQQPLAVGTVCVVEKLDGVTVTVRAKN